MGRTKVTGIGFRHRCQDWLDFAGVNPVRKVPVVELIQAWVQAERPASGGVLQSSGRNNT